MVDWQVIDGWALLRGFLLPIWLTLVSLLCVYAMAVRAAYRVAFRQMRVTGGDQSLSRQRLALTLRTAGRPSLLRSIRPAYAPRVLRFWRDKLAADTCARGSRPGMWCKRGVPRRLCCWVLF